jgi:hypothetical protein
MTKNAKSPAAKPTKPRSRGLDAVAATSAKKGDLTGEVLIAAMRTSPHRGIDIEAERGPMPMREILL